MLRYCINGDDDDDDDDADADDDDTTLTGATGGALTDDNDEVTVERFLITFFDKALRILMVLSFRITPFPLLVRGLDDGKNIDNNDVGEEADADAGDDGPVAPVVSTVLSPVVGASRFRFFVEPFVVFMIQWMK